MKRLMILRHAKSDWSSQTSDHDRPLNSRGRGAAKAIGVALARSLETPDLVITSSATRARTTVELAAKSGGWNAPIEVSEVLYGASVSESVAVAAEAPEDVERLLLAGHQPTWGMLVQALTGASVAMKTATVAAIDLPISSWDRLGTHRGTLSYVLAPRLFTDGNWDLH